MRNLFLLLILIAMATITKNKVYETFLSLYFDLSLSKFTKHS